VALKDLQSDLSKLRDVLDDRGFEDKFPSRVDEGVYAPEPTPIQGVYQDTKNQSTILSPIDAQIKRGVDFFDDMQGGAKGFVPKTNLESFYNKVQEGNVVPPRTHDGTYYANLNPIEGRKSAWRTDSGNYRFMRRGANPPSQAYNDDIFYPPRLGLQTTFYGIAGFNIGNQPAGNAYNSPFQPLPPYNFLNSPISNYVSSFNDNPFSATLGTEAEPIRGDTVYNNRTFTIVNQPVNSWESPLIPNAHMVAQENTDINKTFDVTTMDDMVYGGYNLPGQRSSAGNTQINIAHNKRRGAYALGFPISVFQHQPFPIAQQPNVSYLDRYFSEANGKSIHISSAGQIKAGLRYGAIHQQTTIDEDTEEIIYLPKKFINFNPGNALVDSPATPWSDDFPQFQSDFMTTPIQEFISNYGKVGDNQYGPSLTWGLGAQNYVVAGKIDSVANVWPDTVPPSDNRYSPTPYARDRFLLEGIRDKESILDELIERVEGFSKAIDIKTAYTRHGTNTFANVPAGLNNENKFSLSDYRDVANRGPFEGKDNHPLILRGVGNKWGDDDITADSPFDSALGGIVRGAPTFTGYIDRVLQDRVRIARFMFFTSEGLAFTAKQVALQALNPTIESKMYNPLSTLSIVGASDLLTAIQGGEISGGGVAALGRSIASLFFQIGHPERHLGNGRYENVINSTTVDTSGRIMGRIRLSAQPFGVQTESPKLPKLNESGGGLVKNFINKQINKRMEEVEDGLLGAAIAPFFALSNPNKYTFPISSAPKSITDGVPSFVGGADLALKDVVEASTKPGGTFNKSTSDSTIQGGNNSELVTRHSALAYNKLNSDSGYGTAVLVSPSEKNDIERGIFPGGLQINAEVRLDKRLEGKSINDDIGVEIPNSPEVGGKNGVLGDSIGLVKGNSSTSNVDRINMIPLVPDLDNSLPGIIRNNPDFVKFNFKNVVENKYLVFRAILEGISDNVSPEYNPTRYIGRPDNLYTYVGTNRTIGFNFKIYPKTKQELPILMEKLNYLVGLCYPSYTEQERMITPFIELTIGDMFVRTPGLLNSLTVTVEDASTWEIDEGLQYPHFISCACEFQHIGKYVPHNVGKHYDLSWLSSHRIDDKQPLGTFKKQKDEIPFREETPFGYINNIGPYVNPPLTAPDVPDMIDDAPVDPGPG